MQTDLNPSTTYDTKRLRDCCVDFIDHEGKLCGYCLPIRNQADQDSFVHVNNAYSLVLRSSALLQHPERVPAINRAIVKLGGKKTIEMVALENIIERLEKGKTVEVYA